MPLKKFGFKSIVLALFLFNVSFAASTISGVDFRTSAETGSHIAKKETGGTVSLSDFNTILNVLRGWFVDDNGTPDNALDNKFGLGTMYPSAKLDINGDIIADGLFLRQAFTQKSLPSQQTGTDYNNSCQAVVADLPLAIQTNGRCDCDSDENLPECTLETLIETDQPGCYDLWKKDLDGSYANYPNTNCHDLKSDNITYFELWNLKQENNKIVAPFVTYGNCSLINPTPGEDLGTLIKERLKETTCLNLSLEDGQSYYWNDSVSIPKNTSVSIKTLGALNGAAGAKALIRMNHQNFYEYNSVVYRRPVRARISGVLSISGVKIDETISDDRPITPQSGTSALFTLGTQGTFYLGGGEISATEDIVNFGGFSQNGIFKTGHMYIYRNPMSPRANLYVVRSHGGWNFKGQNGTVGWSNPHVHLNKKIDGTTGTGVEKYPPGNELLRLDYPDDRSIVERDGNVGIGTLSPTQKLEVNGNIKTTGDFYHNGQCFRTRRLHECWDGASSVSHLDSCPGGRSSVNSFLILAEC